MKIKIKIWVAVLTSLVLLAGTLHAQQKEQWVMLKGQLKNFSNQVMVEDMSEFQYLLPPTSERMIVPDENGNFNIKFRLGAPNYFRLGRNSLYLSPGDNLTVFIDRNNPNLATFEGQGAIANNFMKKTPAPKGGSFLESGQNLKDSPQETIALVQELAAKREKELAAVQGLSSTFISLEEARIKADLINSLLCVTPYSSYKFRNNPDQQEKFLQVFKPAISPLLTQYQKDFVSADLMKLVVYRDIADEIIKMNEGARDVQTIKDYYLAYKLVNEMQKVNDKSELTNYSKRIDSIKSLPYRDAAHKTLKQLLQFGKGDVARNFMAVDANGKQVSLESLKGKVLYVDLWATWCGPCMAEMPHFETLKAKYKDNPRVAFVSLSIDDSSELWKKSLFARNADGHQWLINRNKLSDYNIVGIPRVLLIDKDFKIADMNAPSPSSPKAAAAIDQLVAK